MLQVSHLCSSHKRGTMHKLCVPSQYKTAVLQIPEPVRQVLTTPEARRQGARPVLREGARWPCFTLHDYTLQPLAQVCWSTI